MTDTKRSSSPRALLKDRSLSRDVKGGKGLKKNGAGGHNWGRAGAEEFEFDEENFGDNQEEEEYEEEVKSDKSSDVEVTQRSRKLTVDHDIAEAIKIRENAFKGKNIDLGAIARTSAAASTSPVERKFVIPI